MESLHTLPSLGAQQQVRLQACASSPVLLSFCLFFGFFLHFPLSIWFLELQHLIFHFESLFLLAIEPPGNCSS